MNPFVQQAIDLIEKSMDDVGHKIDDIEDSLRNAALSFDYEGFKTFVFQLVELHNTLVKSLQSTSKNFSLFTNQIYLQEPNSDVYFWDMIRPMIYKIERIKEILDALHVEHTSDDGQRNSKEQLERTELR